MACQNGSLQGVYSHFADHYGHHTLFLDLLRDILALLRRW